MYFCRVLFLMLFSCCTVAAHAEPYYDGKRIPPGMIDPPFQALGAEWMREVDDIIGMQKHADPQEIALAKAERHMHVDMVMAPQTRGISSSSHPRLYALLDRVGDTSKAVTDEAKRYWNTRRPYLMDTRVQALIEPHDNPAYPSGHTSGSYVWAHVLSLIFPDSRELFMARAEKIAQHRVLAGMHYPYDVKGGKQLALLIVGALLENAQFRQDLAQAQEEARADKR